MVSRINIRMIYPFYNTKTGEVEEHTMRLAEYDDFKTNNPHLERHFGADSIPGLGDGQRMSVPGLAQPHAAFETGVIQRMRESIPGNTMAGHKTKRPREW
jgi:hypothetical protein